MAKRIPFRLATARRQTDTRVECFADPELFKPWGEMSSKAKQEFDVNGPIPCEGGGLPGLWCDGCRFGHVNEPDDV